MTEFVTQKGKVIHVVHNSVTVACRWSSETPRKPRYTFSWEKGNGTFSWEKGTRPITPAAVEGSDKWGSGADNHPQPDVDDTGVLELEDYPDEEADRLWREEYEEQFED